MTPESTMEKAASPPGGRGGSARRLARRRMTTSCPPALGRQGPRAGDGVPKACGAGLWWGEASPDMWALHAHTGQ